MGRSSTATRRVNISAEIPAVTPCVTRRKVLKVPFIHGNKVLEIKGNFSFLLWCISLCSLLVTAIRASENVKQSAVCFAPRHFSSSEPAECFLLYSTTWRAGTHRCGHANLAWDVTGSDFNVLLINRFLHSEQNAVRSREGA